MRALAINLIATRPANLSVAHPCPCSPYRPTSREGVCVDLNLIEWP